GRNPAWCHCKTRWSGSAAWRDGAAFLASKKAQQCYTPKHDSKADPNLQSCRNFPIYHPHLSCCPADAICLDNGLCLTPSSNSLEILQYRGCTWNWGVGQACPGAEYCRLKNATGYQYPLGSVFNIIPCSSGKYCCSVDEVSNDCCANEEDTFEVSWGPIRDSTTTSYSTWTYTTTAYETTTETVCPATTETLSYTTPVANPTPGARFVA
ncbi:hypothetical protein B0J12DRAFT_733570, partial [Macrophomina phaseolina]